LGALILPVDAPAGLEAALIGLAAETYSCAAAPVQAAACSAYVLEPHMLNYIENERQLVRAFGSRIHAELAAAGIAVHPPEGGFYLLLDFSPFASRLQHSGLNDDAALCESLLEDTGVALLPGSAFGMDAGAYTARLAYVDFDGEAALRDINSLRNAANPVAFVERHANHMLEGIQLLSQWISTIGRDS
jgi:aspartate aminotransferase